jgi:hypothetical protein
MFLGKQSQARRRDWPGCEQLFRLATHISLERQGDTHQTPVNIGQNACPSTNALQSLLSHW